MNSRMSRCDQIIALIDACLAEISAGESVPRAAPDFGSSGPRSASERAELRWASASNCPPVPLDAA